MYIVRLFIDKQQYALTTILIKFTVVFFSMDRNKLLFQFVYRLKGLSS
jgi:hypothetical protein